MLQEDDESQQGRVTARLRRVGGVASDEGPVIVLDTRAPDPRFDTSGLWAKPKRSP